MAKLLFILGVITFIWLQAASARRYNRYYNDMVSEDEPERFHFHSHKSKDEHIQHIKRIAGNYLNFLDIFVGVFDVCVVCDDVHFVYLSAKNVVNHGWFGWFGCFSVLFCLFVPVVSMG